TQLQLLSISAQLQLLSISYPTSATQLQPLIFSYSAPASSACLLLATQDLKLALPASINAHHC
ncbi:hypothetical protein, partial [Paenibacillus camerounensis]|uniref:hypothetical protein n=1 Tax=Paenibacillus camerounensis TaxID=1243663 RepID=UPI001AE0A042